LNSSGAAASVLADALFAELTVPTICTRLPAQGVMSVPVSVYVPTFESFAVEPDVPVATEVALPAVPVAPAVALAGTVPLPAGSVGVADTGGGTGDGVSESAPGFGASGSSSAFASVNG
jgi:hypothetical protein